MVRVHVWKCLHRTIVETVATTMEPCLRFCQLFQELCGSICHFCVTCCCIHATCECCRFCRYSPIRQYLQVFCGFEALNFISYHILSTCCQKTAAANGTQQVHLPTQLRRHFWQLRLKWLQRFQGIRLQQSQVEVDVWVDCVHGIKHTTRFCPNGPDKFAYVLVQSELAACSVNIEQAVGMTLDKCAAWFTAASALGTLRLLCPFHILRRTVTIAWERRVCKDVQSMFLIKLHASVMVLNVFDHVWSNFRSWQLQARVHPLGTAVVSAAARAPVRLENGCRNGDKTWTKPCELQHPASSNPCGGPRSPGKINSNFIQLPKKTISALADHSELAFLAQEMASSAVRRATEELRARPYHCNAPTVYIGSTSFLHRFYIASTSFLHRFYIASTSLLHRFYIVQFSFSTLWKPVLKLVQRRFRNTTFHYITSILWLRLSVKSRVPRRWRLLPLEAASCWKTDK